jgi:Flp pilus assembly protein TadD
MMSRAAALKLSPPPSSHGSPQAQYVGNDACTRCHAEIVASYQKTSMAHASGPAAQRFLPADFVHAPSRVHYRVTQENGHFWLNFDRQSDPSLHGRRELLYYIGSGRRGLTYLFETDGFLFESPINWYADKQLWDTTPAYQKAREAPLNLPVFISCLHCHISEMQPPLAGTENRYREPLLTHSGITCERCHGPGSAHLKGGSIVNPSKLSPDRRDAVCMQCHLEGKVAIERPGRHVYEYRPGDNLQDYIQYFVLEGAPNADLGAVSQVEAFAQSICKAKSGDAMSCMSCHDPHFEPSAAEKVSYYRGKCLTCHTQKFAAKHHPNTPDCVSCHMPASASKDVAHTQVTDHRIPRVPHSSARLLEDAGRASQPRLVSFPASNESPADLRGLALAWESLADSGMVSARDEADRLLRAALRQHPDDPALLSGLAYREQLDGLVDQARPLYQRALALDPNLLDAAVNLGVIDARAGRLEDAVKLWETAFERAPDRSSIGMNLAQVFCASGQPELARKTLDRVLEFNPDLDAAREARTRLQKTPPVCAP